MNIDDKLRKIVSNAHRAASERGRSDERTVMSINQVFADEGYTKTNAHFYATYASEKKKLLRQGADKVFTGSLGNLCDLAARRAAFGDVKETKITADFSNGKLSKLMTGQEFYDRFKEELRDAEFPQYEFVRRAAKRAAGLEPQEEPNENKN